MKRIPINKRISYLIMKVASVAMGIIAIAAVILMLRIRNRSERYILKNIEDSVMDALSDICVLVDAELESYIMHAKESVAYAERMYSEKESFVTRKLDNHVHFTDNNYCFMKYYADENYKKGANKHEEELLANIEYFWKPILDIDNGYITSIYIGTETGLFYSYDKYHLDDNVNDAGDNYFNYFQRPWYIEAKEKGEAIYTDIDLDYFGRGLTLTCATPFYVDGEFAGVVGIDILVDDIRKYMISVDAGPGSYSFAIDKHGNIIAAPDIDVSKAKFENIKHSSTEINTIYDKILSGEPGIELVNKSYYVYSPVKNVGWVICVRMPENIISKSVQMIDKSIVDMILVFIIAALFILFIVNAVSKSFAKHITRPIEKLKDDVQVISKGNLNYKASVIGNDEISDLAISFNDMTESLKTYIDDVTKLTVEKEKTDVELNIATKIQVGMLPSDFEGVNSDKRFSIYATMNPAKEVGGDFYDFFKVDNRHLAIVMADVSGKGIPAALFMAIGKALIKDHTFFEGDLSAVFYSVNNLICEANKDNLFITAFEGLIDLDTGLMKYVNAGHELPYIYKKGKDWEAYRMKPGFVLGGMDNMKFSVGEIMLEARDKIFEYTDGVTEATNANNELYGMDRLKIILDKNSDKSVSELLPSVKKDIDEFVGEAPQFDDITMLGFEYHGV